MEEEAGLKGSSNWPVELGTGSLSSSMMSPLSVGEGMKYLINFYYLCFIATGRAKTLKILSTIFEEQKSGQ